MLHPLDAPCRRCETKGTHKRRHMQQERNDGETERPAPAMKRYRQSENQRHTERDREETLRDRKRQREEMPTTGKNRWDEKSRKRGSERANDTGDRLVCLRRPSLCLIRIFLHEAKHRCLPASICQLLQEYIHLKAIQTERQRETAYTATPAVSVSLILSLWISFPGLGLIPIALLGFRFRV